MATRGYSEHGGISHVLPNSPPGMLLGSHHVWLAEFMAIDGYDFRAQSRGKLSAEFLKNHEREIV